MPRKLLIKLKPIRITERIIPKKSPCRRAGLLTLEERYCITASTETIMLLMNIACFVSDKKIFLHHTLVHVNRQACELTGFYHQSRAGCHGHPQGARSTPYHPCPYISILLFLRALGIIQPRFQLLGILTPPVNLSL